MVYQDYMLFPHLTIRENIAFGLRQRRVPQAEVQDLVGTTSRLLGISHLLDRYPETLSGGEQQRTALARALVLRPRVLLLDEPMSALDSRSRDRISRELVAIQKATGTTIVHITHHFDEVYALADRIAIMHEGKIVQYGEPSEVFLHPVNTFAAEFLCIGNIIRGVSTREGSLARIAAGGQVFYAASGVSGEVIVTLPPEDVILSQEPLVSSARNCLAATVTGIVPAGSTVRILLNAGFPLIALLTRESCRELGLTEGSRVYATFKASAVHAIPVPTGESERTATIMPGSPARQE
jgi:molybdopterin-binding protein